MSDEEYVASQLITGPVFGGPLQGEQASSRFPKGFILVDKPRKLVWIYDWDGTKFQFREPPLPLDNSKRYRAAEGNDYDVMAAPWVGEEDG